MFTNLRQERYLYDTNLCREGYLYICAHVLTKFCWTAWTCISTVRSSIALGLSSTSSVSAVMGVLCSSFCFKVGFFPRRISTTLVDVRIGLFYCWLWQHSF